MNNNDNDFEPGDRVRATRRENFPHGTLVKQLEQGYWLVHWDSDMLETAHHGELTRIQETPG